MNILEFVYIFQNKKAHNFFENSRFQTLQQLIQKKQRTQQCRPSPCRSGVRRVPQRRQSAASCALRSLRIGVPIGESLGQGLGGPLGLRAWSSHLGSQGMDRIQVTGQLLVRPAIAHSQPQLIILNHY